MLSREIQGKTVKLTASELWKLKQTHTEKRRCLKNCPALGQKWGDCSPPGLLPPAQVTQHEPHWQKQLQRLETRAWQLKAAKLVDTTEKIDSSGAGTGPTRHVTGRP